MSTPPRTIDRDVEVVIVGAGISGIGIARRLLAAGWTDLLLLDRADDLGGVWRDNTYPGVAVDIPTTSYSYGPETAPYSARAHATGTEILSYVREVADRAGVTPHIEYRATVEHTGWDEEQGRWVTHLADGRSVSSTYLIAATGLFTTPVLPDIPGRQSFAGTAFHTAEWRHDHDLSGRRVGIIGTGASAVQIVPSIAGTVADLTVFQRTPIWVAPRFDPRLPSEGALLDFMRFGPVRRLGRLATEFIIEWITLAATLYRRAPFLARGLQGLVRHWMRRQVDDPVTRDKLIPSYTLGCKRPGSSNTYLRTFNQPHVRLVTEGIERIDPGGVVTADGRHHALDTLIYATGFLTTEKGNAPSFQVFGKGAVELGDDWDQNRHRAFRGVGVAGFPNFFLSAGPYSGGLNWFTTLEAHVRIIVGCLTEAKRRGVRRVEVDPDAERRYMADMRRFGDGTVFVSPSCASANSYYLDRHGDPSLPLPRTPLWRWWRQRRSETEGFVFGPRGSDATSQARSPSGTTTLVE